MRATLRSACAAAMVCSVLFMVASTSVMCTSDEHMKNSPKISNFGFRTHEYVNLNQTCESIDWSEGGIMSPVRYQGPSCGSSWAMAAVSTVEAVYRIKRGVDSAPPLSVQQIVDCDERSRGCDGGDPSYAYLYIAENGGIVPEENYPYDHRKSNKAGECASREKSSLFVYDIDDLEHVLPHTEAALATAVCRQPVAARIRANSAAFREYRGGIFRGECGDRFLSHVVTVVGFGTDENGFKYWKIQNSWGSFWGEEGYMRLIKDSGDGDGHCGIALDAVYPILDGGYMRHAVDVNQ